MKITYMKYVPLGFVHVWEKAGWEVTPILNDTHHGVYAACMEWRGEGEPVCPRIEDAA